MIVPAILASENKEFKELLHICESFVDYVQIDIMDGYFVPSKSVDIDFIKKTKTKLKSEAHLMVRDPLLWLDVFKKFGSHRIIFHFEACNKPARIIEEIRKQNFEVGLAINPQTKISEFKSLVNDIDMVLFMSVNPGFYGSKFIPQVLSKIKKFKSLYPAKLTGIDGGIKLQNIVEVKKSGVDCINIGSAILKAPNPKKAYLELLNAIK